MVIGESMPPTSEKLPLIGEIISWQQHICHVSHTFVWIWKCTLLMYMYISYLYSLCDMYTVSVSIYSVWRSLLRSHDLPGLPGNRSVSGHPQPPSPGSERTEVTVKLRSRSKFKSSHRHNFQEKRQFAKILVCNRIVQCPKSTNWLCNVSSSITNVLLSGSLLPWGSLCSKCWPSCSWWRSTSPRRRDPGALTSLRTQLIL